LCDNQFMSKEKLSLISADKNAQVEFFSVSYRS